MKHYKAIFVIILMFSLISTIGIWGCTPTDSDPPDFDTDTTSEEDQFSGLMRIDVTPFNDILEISLNVLASQPFVATGVFPGDVTKDLTEEVQWSSDNKNVGIFDVSGTILNIPEKSYPNAEMTTVTAKYGDVQGKAQLTVVAYGMSGDKHDYFFNLPYNDKEGEQNKPLDFLTNVPSLDVFFNMDTTSSMGGFVANLRDSLISVVLPSIRETVDDTWFGVGRFDDFPIKPYGYGMLDQLVDQPFELVSSMTDNDIATLEGIQSLGWLHAGEDIPESFIESLYQIATGEGLPGPEPIFVASDESGVGGAGFRDYSMPVIIPMTDAPTHTVGEGTVFDYTDLRVLTVAHSRSETVAALNKICAKVVGVSGPYSDSSGVDFAIATGTVVPPEAWGTDDERPPTCLENYCCTGEEGDGQPPGADGLCPLAFKVDENGKGLSENIVTGIRMLTKYATFDVNTEVEGKTKSISKDPLPDGFTTADFIKEVKPLSYDMPKEPDWLPDPTITDTGYDTITPGTSIEFSVNAYNDFLKQESFPQFFEATISVVAGGCTPLDERLVLILVPPNPVPIK